MLGGALAIGVAGWQLGILRTTVALLAIVAGVVLAGAYHERVFIDLAISEAPNRTMRLASFSVILGVVVIGGYLAGTLLRGAASVLLLGGADRLAGGLFGVIIGLLLAQALIAMVVLADFDDAEGVLGQSVVGRAMMQNAPVVRALLPSEFDLAIQRFVGELDALQTAAEEARRINGS